MVKIDKEKVQQMHFNVQLEHTILVLNQINDLDPTVLPRLIGHRVSCNQALADHPTVQVGKTEEGFEVGLLGIVNGFFDVKKDSYGYICARYSDNELGQIERFELLD